MILQGVLMKSVNRARVCAANALDPNRILCHGLATLCLSDSSSAMGSHIDKVTARASIQLTSKMVTFLSCGSRPGVLLAHGFQGGDVG